MRDRPEYLNCEVYSLPLWGMAVKTLQCSQVEPWESVTTIEDHLEDGGFGSWLSEALGRDPALRMRLHSLALSPEVCGLVGSQATLNARGGLR